MTIKNKVRPNSYHDSATLMLITNRMAEQLGAKNVAVMMATDMNKDILKESELLDSSGESATPNDLIFAARGDDEAAVEGAIEKAETALDTRSSQTADSGYSVVRSLDSALREVPDANISVISVPGQYARGEVMKSLDKGLHVLLFSDNVSLEDEIEMKDYALERGLLMMGPDCGTAIINHTPLAFANSLERGDIGIVAASGTGLQETSVLISRLGSGVTQAIGTGGRDVKEAVGGRMMLAGIDALDADPATKVILLVAKPPATQVIERLTERIKRTGKPVVTCFLGDKKTLPTVKGATSTYTLEAAAVEAVAVSKGVEPSSLTFRENQEALTARLADEQAQFSSSQKFVRGLYAGGTLCYETILIARDALPDLSTNTPVSANEALEGKELHGHTFLDLGEDEFTRGRPHPMIEPSLRNQWIIDQGDDETVAVLLIDLVIGFGAHEDPAGIAAEAIVEAKNKASKAGRHLSVVASVCGTEGDYQGFQKQRRVLEDVGVVVLPSNAQAAEFAVRLVGGTINAK